MIAVDGSNLIRSDRNKKSGGVVCYDRENIWKHVFPGT